MKLKTGMHNSLLKRKRSRLLVSHDVRLGRMLERQEWYGVANKTPFKKTNIMLDMKFT